jgi:hypothetical protein
MSREAHVQFWEGLAVRLRRATQLFESVRVGQPRPAFHRRVRRPVQPETAPFESGRSDTG